MTTENTTPNTPVKKPSRKRVKAKSGTRLTESEKAEAITLWERGDITYEGLEKRFGRSTTTFQTLFTSRNIVRGSKKEQAAKEMADAVATAANQNAVIYAQRVKDIKEARFKSSENVRKLSTSLIAEARAKGLDMSTQLASMKTIEVYGKILKMAFDEGYLALGVDPNDIGEEKPLPELVVQELTAAQIEELIKGNRVGSEDALDTDGLMGDEGLFDTPSSDDKVEVNE